MRTLAVVVGLALAAPLAAQDPAAVPDTGRLSTLESRLLPGEIAREVTAVYNDPATRRVSGPHEIPADSTLRGDIAVLDGTLTVAGRVNGRVVAINGDVVLLPGSHVEGEIIVVGGGVRGRDAGFIGGDVRIYREALHYDRRDGQLVARTDAEEDERWWRRRERRWRSRTYSDIRLVSARTYNRVAGLPILLGPSFRRPIGDARLSVDAYGIFRTGDDLEWNPRTIGHDVRTELRFGRTPGLAIGGKLYDVVDPVEEWHLTDTEVGLASFFLHRDYRDYFDRHGGGGYASLVLGNDATLTVEYADERWGSRNVVDPWTLFRNDQGWRPNPSVDEGRFYVSTARLGIDTRNSTDDPWSGWYFNAEVERGTGRTTSLGLTSAGVRDDAATGPISWTRGFLDVRRYNRVSPDGMLNMRVVLGGWMNGDELPLQRRLSVGGPGTLPGFDFRRESDGTDVGTCGGVSNAPLGLPAQCERIALAQVEYRGDLHIDLFDWDRRGGDGWDRDGQWVVFADAGRGWLVGERSGDVQYEKDEIPSLSTFRSDIGIGLVLGTVGFYVAKAVSDSDQPANFFVRIKRRF